MRRTRTALYLVVPLGLSLLPGCITGSKPAARKSASHSPAKSAAKVEIEELQEGTGPTPKEGQTVTVAYTGRLKDGTKFDSSEDHGRPLEFVLGKGDVIKGWEDAVGVMKVGGKYRVTVPPALGYGAKGNAPKIPPNATLVFEMELLGAKDKEEKHAKGRGGHGGGRRGGMGGGMGGMGGMGRGGMGGGFGM